MYRMFQEKHPEVKLSYDSYRKIFNEKFNIAFGYPRSDTCSKCDELNVQLKALGSKLSKEPEQEQELKKLETEKKLHLSKANVFYSRKREAKEASRRDAKKEAICLDYAKNLPIPNIPTNDVYYSRQLSLYTFNVHVLSTNQSIFYAYPETVGKKGSDNVCSLLHHYIYNYLDNNVRDLQIFCDSCGGQNKNYTMFRFLYHVIHYERKLDAIHVTFPIRGHSYMECDKDFGLINQKTRAETPREWMNVIESARVKPTAFNVEEVRQHYFRSWEKHLHSLCKKKCPFQSRPIREMKFSIDHPRLVFFRETFNGFWESADIVGKTVKIHQGMEFKLPDYLYTGKKSNMPMLFKQQRFVGLKIHSIQILKLEIQ